MFQSVLTGLTETGHYVAGKQRRKHRLKDRRGKRRERRVCLTFGFAGRSRRYQWTSRNQGSRCNPHHQIYKVEITNKTCTPPVELLSVYRYIPKAQRYKGTYFTTVLINSYAYHEKTFSVQPSSCLRFYLVPIGPH